MKPTLGYTLVEMIVGIVLASVVSLTALGVVMAAHRAHSRATDHAEAGVAARDAMWIVPAELSGLSGADLMALAPGSAVYSVARSHGFLCRRPDVTLRELHIKSWIGVRDGDPSLDTLLVFVDGDPSTRRDDRWWRTDLVNVVWDAHACADGSGGLRVTVGGAGASELEEVRFGAAVRAHELDNVRLYASLGSWWLGIRTYQKRSARWPATQPVLGPLHPGGFSLRGYGSDGLPAPNPVDVTVLGFSVAGGQSGRMIVPEILVGLRNASGQ